MVKQRCHDGLQGYRQTKGLHHTESSSSTVTAASIRMALVSGLLKDREIRHLKFEQAYPMADIGIKIYTELPEES